MSHAAYPKTLYAVHVSAKRIAFPVFCRSASYGATWATDTALANGASSCEWGQEFNDVLLSQNRLISVILLVKYQQLFWLLSVWLEISTYSVCSVGKFPASSVNEEVLEVLKKQEQDKVDNLLNNYITFCGEVCFLYYHSSSFIYNL